MNVIGLTGGIGMGKSKAAELLSGRGWPVVDTDILARQVVEPGELAIAEIQAAFGPHVLKPDGSLNREVLAGIVFPDPAKRRVLESILHPKIRERWRSQMEAWGKEGRPFGVVIIPLLFETEAQRECDAVICVACSATTQRRRLQHRGWSAEQIDQRITAQMPVEQKMLRSNYVVWTEAGLDVHAAQLERIFSRWV